VIQAGTYKGMAETYSRDNLSQNVRTNLKSMFDDLWNKYTSDIAAKLDSMAVGHTSGIIENTMDNTLNVIRLIAKQQLPDSIEYRQIQVGGASADVAHKSADSIYAALKAGADFEAVAKKYGQTGQKAWMTTQQYQNAPSMDNDTKNYITSLNMMAVNETKNIVLPQGNIIVQVLSRKAMTDKYIAAVIKKVIDFSKATRSDAYNKFSEFVAKSTNVADLEKNAPKSGYQVQSLNDISTVIFLLPWTKFKIELEETPKSLESL